MRNTALGTNPVSHAEVFQPSRAADCVTARTDLGTVSLVRINEPCPVPHGRFVSERRAKRGPTGIEDGFRHPGAGQRRAVYVAHTDQGIRPDNVGAGYVQEVPPLGGDLPVDLARQFLAPGPLCAGQLRGRLADMARVPDLLAARNGGKRMQAEINPYLARTGRQVIGNPTDKVEIPAPRGVLAETAGTNILWDRTRQPHSVSATETLYGVASDLERPVALERHPPQGPLRPTADAPPRPTVCRVSADSELLADRLDGVAVQAEFLAAAIRQAD